MAAFDRVLHILRCPSLLFLSQQWMTISLPSEEAVWLVPALQKVLQILQSLILRLHFII